MLYTHPAGGDEHSGHLCGRFVFNGFCGERAFTACRRTPLRGAHKAVPDRFGGAFRRCLFRRLLSAGVRLSEKRGGEARVRRFAGGHRFRGAERLSAKNGGVFPFLDARRRRGAGIFRDSARTAVSGACRARWDFSLARI